jgi:hypothetical protein
MVFDPWRKGRWVGWAGGCVRSVLCFLVDYHVQRNVYSWLLMVCPRGVKKKKGGRRMVKCL